MWYNLIGFRVKTIKRIKEKKMNTQNSSASPFQLWPAISPFKEDFLPVSEIHKIHYALIDYQSFNLISMSEGELVT